MKKFLKGLFGLALIGGVAAGIYYYLIADKYSDVDDFDDEADALVLIDEEFFDDFSGFDVFLFFIFYSEVKFK